MAILFAFALFAILMAAISYFGYRRYARPARVYEQLGGQAAYAMPTVDKTGEEPGLTVWVMQQIGDKVPISPDDAWATRRDLISAGYRSEQALALYLGTRIVACVGLVALALLFRGYITSNPILA